MLNLYLRNHFLLDLLLDVAREASIWNKDLSWSPACCSNFGKDGLAFIGAPGQYDTIHNLEEFLSS